MNNNNFTTTKIDFINNIDQKIIKQGKFHYFKFNDWNLSSLMYFIEQIKDEKIFSVFPLVSTTGNPCDPYLRLSNHFLITNKSNPKLIFDFINLQWKDSDWFTESEYRETLYFKFKLVIIKPGSFE